ncbi:MAG: type II toxin-antitoxin system Phd/YefM family antitoxin [Candidatus Saccharimonadales bacterium]
MKTLQVREAKAGLSALIADAEQGRPTLITRHGRPAAMLVSVESGHKLNPEWTPNLIDYLHNAPEALLIKRNRRGLRDVNL